MPHADPPAPPERPDDSHKGTFGTVIVVGGSATMPGAPALAAPAALRSGAGLVKIAAPAAVLATALAVQPSATGMLLEVGDSLAAKLDDHDSDARGALAVGPGLGTDDHAAAVVRDALRSRRDVVLDADGLNVLAADDDAADADWLDRRDRDRALILTPHPGEYRRLAARFDIDADPTLPAGRPRAATQLAERLGAVVVLKGHRSIIADAEHHAVNHTGNPALATAGSGDVLTGLLAALLAQGMAAFDAARLAAHLHGAAADAWAKRHGVSGMTALDLACELPDVFRAARIE